jgi:two-component system response regulator AtoC
MILVVDDDPRLRETLEILIRRLGHEVSLARDLAEAERRLEEFDVDLVITDLRMPGGSGLDVLEMVRRVLPDVPVIVFTGYGTVATAVGAMKMGAFDYLQKPFETSELELRIERALEQRRHEVERSCLRGENGWHSNLHAMIGVSPAMIDVMEAVRQVACSDASVLVTGESGTGKELVAREIHRRSTRSDGLFVPISLGAIPPDLLETELFGHVRGAFTGAVEERIGKFELAHRGMLFLDEIGDVPLELQSKLLRVVQDGVIERVGSNQRRKVDVRIVSATHRDLEAMVETGDFRLDLFYRLNVVQIRVPPLRERREDIRYLTAHFLLKHGQGRLHRAPRITEEALQRLEEYAWPGNVRELSNVVERALVLARGDTLDERLFELATPALTGDRTGGLRLDALLDRVERETIERALEEAANVKARAARLLGISQRNLWYKLKKHGLT